MWSHRERADVGGAEPPLVAGNVALDFVNTRAVRHGRSVEGLPTPGAALDWLVRAGSLAPGDASDLRRSPSEARLLRSEALALRDVVGALVTEHAQDRPPPPLAVHAINRVLAAASTHAVLVGVRDGFRLEERSSGAGLLAPLVPVAEAAARLLTDADPSRLRRCASEACGVWFLDTSRNGRRRWCSMDRCGNRAKAARHYRRTRSGTDAPPTSA